MKKGNKDSFFELEYIYIVLYINSNFLCRYGENYYHAVAVMI